MGRRSVSTTKSGKFMNPTDQARKEARKKELKKNKKQRLLVRTAVLKNKDPGMIIQELDKLDEIEFNPVEAPALAEKVLKDKRKKLRETMERVMKLYQKEDPALWNELKSIENDYERRRFQRIQYYEAVKQAESISVEDIPLPSNNPPPSVADIPLPPSDDMISAEPQGILKKSSGGNELEAPGVPPGSPPDMSSGDEDEDEAVGSSNTEKEKKEVVDKQKKTVHFDDDLDQFMKEVEQEFKTRVEEELQPPGLEKAPQSSSSSSTPQAEPELPPPPGVVPLPSMMPPPMPPQMPQQPPPNRMHFYGQRPPPVFPGVRGPFPRIPPPVPNRQPFTGYRPRFKSNVYTSGPQLSQKEVITAKPQIRSLSADVTRFVPVAVKTNKAPSGSETATRTSQIPSRPVPVQPQQTGQRRDDAYAEFMKEMQGLL